MTKLVLWSDRKSFSNVLLPLFTPSLLQPSPLTLPPLVLASGEFRFLPMNSSRDRLIRCLMLAVCVIFGWAKPACAAPKETSGNIQEMMTPEEFRAAGLNKLSPDELQKLDAWLQGYRQITEQKAEKKATARAEKTKMDVI